MKIKFFLKNHKIELIIFFIALVLRLLVFYAAAAKVNFVYEDLRVDGYYEIAYNLANHFSFSESMVNSDLKDSVRTPGLPVIVAIFIYLFNGVFGFIILQIIIGSLLPLLGRKLSLLFKLPLKVANFIGLFMAFDPLALSLSVKILTETFFTLFFLIAIIYLLIFLRRIKDVNDEYFTWSRAIPVFSAAVFLGVSTLFRPTTIYLPLFLTLFWLIMRLLKKQKLLWRYIAIFLFFSYILLMPWFYRNYETFHVAAFSSIKDNVLNYNLAPSILAIKNNQSFEEGQKEFFSSEGLNYAPNVLLDKAAWFRERSMKVIYDNPAAFLRVGAISIFTFFTHDGALDFLSLVGLSGGQSSFPHGFSFFKQSLGDITKSIIKISASPLALVLSLRIIWALIFISFIFFFCFLIFKKQFNPDMGLLFIIIAYFALATIANGLAVNARFRFPVDSLILIFTANSWIIYKRVINTLVDSA